MPTPKEEKFLTVTQLVEYYEKELGHTLFEMERMANFSSKEFQRKTLYAERCECLMALFEVIEYRNEVDHGNDDDGYSYYVWF